MSPTKQNPPQHEYSDPHAGADDLDVAERISRLAGTVLERVGPSTVTIGRDGRGAGVVVGPDRVLTNAHHLRDRTTQVTFPDGRATQGAVRGADPHGDLVVLEVDTGEAPAVTFSDAPAAPGQLVFALTRDGRGLRIAMGLVSGTDRVVRGPGGRRLTGALEHGASLGRGATGGPVVAADGTVLAVNTHRLPGGAFLALTADRSLRDRVAGMSEGHHVRRPVLGVALAGPEVAARLRRAVGLDERTGLLVREVDEGGAGARAGLREGDLLVRAGDRELSSPSQLVEALDAAGPGGRLTLGVVRGAEELELTADLGDGESDPDASSGAGTSEDPEG